MTDFQFMQPFVHYTRRALAAIVCLGGLAVSSAYAQFSILAEFPQQLIRPTSGLVQGPNLVNSNVRLYGVSEFGGTAGGGVLFMYEPATNTVTTIADFGRDFGTVAAPAASSARIGSGEHRLAVVGNVIYGVAREGGTSGYGCIWRWAPTAGTPSPRPELLGSFDLSGNGGYPSDGLVSDSTSLYGVCKSGGNNGVGTVWKMAATGGTISVLHHFQKRDVDLAIGEPVGGLAISGAELYGYARRITSTGAVTDVIYGIPTGGGSISTVYTFNPSFASGDGYPAGTLISAAGGLFYGVLYENHDSMAGQAKLFRYSLGVQSQVLPGSGHGRVSLTFLPTGLHAVTESGASAAGNGSVYRWDLSQSPGQQFVTLGQMSSSSITVSRPSGSVYRDSTGAVFGTCEGPSSGSVWRLPSGASPSVIAVSSFGVPTVGGRPNGVVASSNGDILGYESIGQSIWRYNPAAAGSGLQRLDFFNVASGSSPAGQVLADASGQLIGQSSDGAKNGQGSIWTWTQHGGVSSRFDFPANEEATGGMVTDAAGNIFRTSNNFTGAGDTTGPVTTLWKLGANDPLATFSKGTHGSYAFGPIVMGVDGAIYGICLMGGTKDGGTLWKWTQAGGLVELFPFEFNTNFQRPQGGLIVRADGSLYGTCGPVTSEAARVWRFTPGDPTPMVRHGNIAKATQGQYFETVTRFKNLSQRPVIAVLAPVVERAGVLFGVTDFGSASACGSLWTISLGGSSPQTVNTAHNFRRSTASEGRVDGGRGLFSLAVGADTRVYGVGDDALWAFGAVAATRPPSVVTNPISAPTATKVTLNGAVNPHGASTTVSFEYGIKPDAMTETVVAAQSPLSGSTTTAVTAEAKFLESSKPVYYRVKAVSANGTSFGAIAQGVTSAASGVPPVVTTLPASEVSHNSLKLNGKVTVGNPIQTAENVFVWGLSEAALINRAAVTPPTAAGAAEVSFSGVISGLSPHTEYFFQARSATILGMGRGKTFKLKTLNRDPVATGDTFFARPSSPITLPILANDTDPDTDVVSIKSFVQLLPAQGKLTKVGSNLLFTPAATFSGATFTYIAQDAFTGVSNSATVTLNVDTLAIDPTANPGTLAALTMSYPVTIDVGQPATPWIVQEASPFVSVTPTSGSGDGIVTVTVATNTAKTPRTATVMIGGVTHSINQPGVVVPAFAALGAIPPAVVSGSFSLPFNTTTPAFPAPSFVASNLPKGLTIVNPTSGAPNIEGFPEKAGTYNVVIKAINAAAPAATAPALQFTIVVRELPAELVGVHTALVEANIETGLPGGPTNFNRKVGAHVNFTTTPLGTFSGTVRLGKGTKAPDTLPFKGRIQAIAASSPGPISATATVNVARKAPLAPLVLTLNFDSAQNNVITGSLEAADDVLSRANFTGWRNKWSATAPATVLVDAKNKPLREYYTVSLSPPSSAASANPPEPLGWGYLTTTLQPLGTLAWAGVLADGTAVSGTSTLSPTNNKFIVFAPLYQRLLPAPAVQLGVLAGMPAIARASNPAVLGTLKWVKEAQSSAPGVAPTYTYLNAYAHDLLAEGNLYTPPPAIIFGLTFAAGNNNAVLDFANGGIAAPHTTTIDQTFAINTANTALFTVANNLNLVKLTINKTLGLFNGTFTLVDGAIKRSNIVYRGVLRPNVVPAMGRGYGYFVLPQLPVTGTSTLDTPRLSGSVLLRPQ